MKAAVRAKWLLLGPVLAAGLAAENPEASQSVARKLQQVTEGSLPSGSSIEVTQEEMTAFLRHHGRPSIPEWMEDPQVEFRAGGVVLRGTANLDEAAATAENFPLVLRLLLRGTRVIVLDADYAVNEGLARVRLVSVAIDETELRGAVLEWLLEQLAPPELRPYLAGQTGVRQAGVRETRVVPGLMVLTTE